MKCLLSLPTCAGRPWDRTFWKEAAGLMDGCAHTAFAPDSWSGTVWGLCVKNWAGSSPERGWRAPTDGTPLPGLRRAHRPLEELLEKGGKHSHQPPSSFPDFGLGPFRKAGDHLNRKSSLPAIAEISWADSGPGAARLRPSLHRSSALRAVSSGLFQGRRGSKVGSGGVRPPGAQGWAGRGRGALSSHWASRLGIRAALR